MAVHHALLLWVLRSYHSVFSILEELFFRIKNVQDGHDVFPEAMRIDVEIAEGAQILKHFVDTIPDDEPHFISTTQSDVVYTLRPFWIHLLFELWVYCLVNCKYQSVINIEYDVQTRLRCQLGQLAWCQKACVLQVLCLLEEDLSLAFVSL